MKDRIGADQLSVGERAIVMQLHTVGSMRRRLLDIGLLENTVIECVGRAPSGDPIAFSIRGAIMAIRREDCRNILVRTV